MNCVSDEKDLPVEADFPAGNDDEFGIMIECGECVTFHDRSTADVFEVLWNFEGGDPSITTKEVSLVVCYENPGKFDMTLLVKGKNGQDVITRTEFVEVLPKEPEPLNASFSADTAEIVQNQMIMLMDESTSPPGFLELGGRGARACTNFTGSKSILHA